jgi:pimeloyl-ACP methyl ester carboxylesterase
MRRLLLALALASLPVHAASSKAPAAVPVPRLETGQIAGALFTIARPARWNRQVLLTAHGLRAPDSPLVADLDPRNLAYKALLEEGWIVATTSYRRNGLIIADAIADLDALRDHIAETYGKPERVLLEGDSMGGLIVTLIAERSPEIPPLYHGAVAVGAALDIREPNSTAAGLTLMPKIPLLFLTNQSELAGPRQYVAADIPVPATERAVLFRVSRDGHVNVNQRERLLALRAINTWIERGRNALPAPAPGAAFFDATSDPMPSPSQVVRHPDGRGFDTLVTAVSVAHGNISINAQPADFLAAGIVRMSRFQLTAGDQKFRVMYGKDFNSVKRSEWVALVTADGFFQLARNSADAAATAKIHVGDLLSIRRYDEAR